MKKREILEIKRKIDFQLKAMNLLLGERELPLGEQERELAGEIVHKISETCVFWLEKRNTREEEAAKLQKITFYANTLDFFLAEKDVLLGKEGMEVVGKIIDGIRQAADGLGE